MEQQPLQIVRENDIKNAHHDYIIVNKEYCEKIIKKMCIVYSASKVIVDAYDKDKGYYKLRYRDIQDILNGLKFKHSITIESKESEEKRENIVNTYLKNLPYYDEREKILKKCMTLQRNYYNIYSFLDYIFSDKQIMMETFELLCDFVQLDYKFYYMVDLIAAKDDILKNLKYIYDEKTVKVFEEQYDLAIEKFDVNALKDLLESTQDLILKHWKEYLTNVADFKSGEPFKFLCHSITISVFEGDFHSNVISTSLLTEDLLDVFGDEYGFILPATNIVVASSTDMYVNNYAETDDSILYYSTINKISVPERLVEETLDLKSQIESNVYNEVAKRGFDPVGIFCLTDGSKSLDENYVNAYKLHEKFPKLKVIEIDKSLYVKDDERLNKIIGNLIYLLKKIINGDENIVYLDEIKELVKKGAYNGFWAEYMELKQKYNYTEEDIIVLFKKYEKLINDYNDVDNMFEKLNHENLVCFLKYSQKYGVWAVLQGNQRYYYAGILQFELSDLKMIYNNLKQYTGDKRLDDVIPGLAEFLQLYRSISFDSLCDNAKLRICSCDNFLDINHILLSYLRKEDLERIGYESYNYTLDNLESVEDLNASLPMILELEEMINSKTKEIMDYLDAELFLEKNKGWFVYYWEGKDKIDSICHCEKEIEDIAVKKAKIQKSNAIIDQIIEVLSKQIGANIVRIRKLNKKRLKNDLKYDKLLKAEEQNKITKAKYENEFSYYKNKFKTISGYDYDWFAYTYTHALEINEKNIQDLVFNKNVLDKQLEEILGRFGLTIGQLHDYVEKYYDNGPTGPTM